MQVSRWRINTLRCHRLVIIDSVDKCFKLNKWCLGISNNVNQKHERNDLPCFNLPSWNPRTMHRMRGSSGRNRSSFYMQPSTLLTYHGLKSTDNNIQYFYSLTQHMLLTKNAVVYQLETMGIIKCLNSLKRGLRWIRRYVDKVQPHSLGILSKATRSSGQCMSCLMIIQALA